MKKLVAIGTLLLSSAAVFASPAVTVNRNVYNNQTANHGYVAPAPTAVSWSDRARFEREQKARLEARLRAERLERERRERELRLRYRNSYRNRW
jgi:hypothetical protein